MGKYLLQLLAGLLASVSCVAAPPVAPAANKPPENTLTVAMTRHLAICPPPGPTPCTLRKPVSTPYRLLTPGIDLEDVGDYWLLSFAKARSTAPVTLRVLGHGGELHEVLISFSARSAPKAKATAKPL